MWTCTCGHQNSDIGNFCVACGMAKNEALAAQLSDDVAWFYYRGNQRFGPVHAREIGALVHEGVLDRDTLIWKAGMDKWTPLHQTALGALAPHLMPPAPLQSVSDVYAWLLAILPVVVGMVLSILKANYFGVILAVGVLTILFWGLDVWELKKAKNDLSTWIWLVFLLTPAYLFVRAGKVGQRYGYAIAWCVIYVCWLFMVFILRR